MEIRVNPYHTNLFPIRGIFIRGTSVVAWIREIQRLKFDLRRIELYPIPGDVANSIVGCLIVTPEDIDLRTFLGQHEAFQMASEHLLLPEKSILYPPLTPTDIEALFPAVMHCFHPDFGLVEMNEQVDISSLIELPELHAWDVKMPQSPAFIPLEIKSYQLIAPTPEEILHALENELFPQQRELEDTPLSPIEKGKLGILSLLFTSHKNSNSQNEVEKTPLLTFIESALLFFKSTGSEVARSLQQDFEELERRNMSQLDKLMDMLRRDPENALLYAIPLDTTGTSRGGTVAQFHLRQLWANFSMNQRTAKGKGAVNVGDKMQELRKQYHDTAQQLIHKKDYRKAAFIYMKLLQNKTLAAETLELGGHFQEAAAMYLHHLGNKKKAAECYEKGSMTREAIELYTSLQKYEKVGDLYMTLNKISEARAYYEMRIKEYTARNQYVQASLIYSHKVRDIPAAQVLLLKGWQSNHDAFNCLNNYMATIDDISILQSELQRIYSTERNEGNSMIFLKVLRYEYKKHAELTETIREMAFAIVAEQIPKNPSIVSELRAFNPDDIHFRKDTIRFTLFKRR